MIELNPKIKKALLKIDFIKQYEQISNAFNDEKHPKKRDLNMLMGKL